MVPPPTLRSLVLQTKLYPPRQRPNRAMRAHLLKQLDAAQTRLTLLVAPAGYGKTTLLSQWARTRPEPVTWLTLTPEDNALPIFVSSLIAAIQLVAPDLVDRAIRRDDATGGGDIETLLATVLSEVEASDSLRLLMLDDYQVIDNAQVDYVIRQLLEHTPDTFRVVVASRTRLRLTAGRRHYREQLTLIGPEDLRVSALELPGLLAEHGIMASEAEQRALLEHTNGWIVALHLAALAAREQSLGSVIESLAAFSGNFELLGEFLLQEVLDRQPPELRRFLLKTAVLSSFTVEACRAVTENVYADRLFEQIQRRNLFLIRHDQPGGWFHYHHLFGDFLRRRLMLELEPHEVARLHLAASCWSEQQGLLSDAISHAVSAEAWQRAAVLISGVATKMVLTHADNDLLQWLLSYPTTVLYADANLSSLMAYLLVRRGRSVEAEPLLAAAGQKWAATANANGLAVVSTVRGTAARFRDDDAGLLANAVEAIAHATGEAALDTDVRLDALAPRLLRLEGTWLGHIGQQLCYAHLAMGLRLQGRLAEAAALYRQIEVVFRDDGQVVTSAYYAPESANISLSQGLLTRAESICRAFLQLDSLASERMLAMALLGEVLREWNRLPESEQVTREGLALAVQVDTPIVLPLLYNTLARTLWSRRDETAAVASLEAALEAAHALENVRRAREAAAQRAQIALANGDLTWALRWAADRGFGTAGVLARSTVPELLVFARLLLAQDEPARAVALLAHQSVSAERDGRLHELVHIEVLRSMACFELGNREQALAVLQVVLDLAAREGYLQPFIDEGPPMHRLLSLARRHGAQLHHVQQLLADDGGSRRRGSRTVHPELVEPITARELQVLQLMAVGLTNRELSDELIISLPTVKRHVSNLYGKLGVSSRSEALQKARRLGLLPERRSAPGGVRLEPE